MTNSTWRAAPWADVLYAVDHAWWEQYMGEARAGFAGELISHSKYPGTQRASSTCVQNSGANAIALAASRGASRIVLLGYDLQHTNGMRHWHGDHPKTLKNAGSIGQWPAKFAKLARQLPAGVDVINCSRATVLAVFPRAQLENVLA